MGSHGQDATEGKTEGKPMGEPIGHKTVPEPMYDTRIPDAIDAFLFISLALCFAVAAIVTLYLVVVLGSLPWLVVLTLASVAIWEVVRLLIDGDLGRKPITGTKA